MKEHILKKMKEMITRIYFEKDSSAFLTFKNELIQIFSFNNSMFTIDTFVKQPGERNILSGQPPPPVVAFVTNSTKLFYLKTIIMLVTNFFDFNSSF